VTNVIYIDAPEALTRRQRTVGALITAVMWAAYAYLWLPLVSLFAWGLGFELAYDAVVRAGGAGALRAALSWYGFVLANVVVMVAIWSLFNRWRFAGKNRRTAHPSVTDGALAECFGIAADDLERLRVARHVELDVDARGRPIVHDSPQSRAPARSQAPRRSAR
jgi:biofilm PGA synthesis protein PgaD